MPLNDTALRKLKPCEKDVKLSDGGGMYLHVKATGSKTWRMDYRFLSVRKTLTFGTYPDLGLAAARERREDARKLLANGIDPGVQKRRDRRLAVIAQGNTFGLLADEFLDKMVADGKAEATLVKNRWMLKDLAAPLARLPITDITSAEILDVLKKIEASGRTDTSLATRSAIGRVFRYAIGSARAETDPTFALRGALRRHTPESHPAITNADKLPGLVNAVWGHEGWPSLAAALKIQMLCFARPGETLAMEWHEIDLGAAVWSISAHKAKMRRVQDVPLSRQATDVIKSMLPFRSDHHTYVFPSMMSGKKLLSENSMNSALRRMGFSKEEHTAHGFRSTASTLLNEAKMNGTRLFDPDWIEVQLAHKDKDTVRGIYNRALYWDDRVRMMQWWADFLDEQRRGRAVDPEIEALLG